MEDVAVSRTSSEVLQHKRTKSSVLKSLMPGHQRKPSSKAASLDNDENESSADRKYPQSQSIPPDHPHTRQHLREDSGNRNYVQSPRKMSVGTRKETSGDNGGTRVMTRSTSFKSSMDKDKGKSPKKKRERSEDKSMKKSKSSTSLSNLLSRPKSSRGVTEPPVKNEGDKENEKIAGSMELAPPPIWAQFTTQALEDNYRTSKVPLNDLSLEDEVRLYTPKIFSPSKQRNFPESQQPTLSHKCEGRPRPKSDCLRNQHTVLSFAETVSSLHRSKQDQQNKGDRIMLQSLQSVETKLATASKSEEISQRSSADLFDAHVSSSKPNLAAKNPGSHVKAVVAAYNSKTKDLPTDPPTAAQIAEVDCVEIERAFESLLEARNVPQGTRDKMRSLDTNIKADFIKKDKTGSASSMEGLSLLSSRPGTGRRSQTEDGSSNYAHEERHSMELPKKQRPRSRTFTFTKGDQSPSKKQKSERPPSRGKAKSEELPHSESSKSFFAGAAKPTLPGEYIMYLRKVPKPESVEVGKIHKLRQLLRNETVGWVDDFILQGGMTELVGLLNRIIGVEWRVDHEDELLHVTLMCLKALSTTSSALHQLSEIQSTLFPTLLSMLFDREKKGPSEYVTRGIIINLLSTYLFRSRSSNLETRARTLLSYFRDPSPPEDSQPHRFISSIYHSRPYRVWNKELDNITKEVFWIFLHHVNIVPYPEVNDAATSYTERHFPREHPPVPAAPYTGGVEWDATNYLTAHIDLLNGLIASLPTREERNNLRQELRDSGFEKVMAVSLRTCKVKLYPCVQEALSTWVGAAKEDDWPYQDVRLGPKPDATRSVSPKKSPKKKDLPPQLEMPKLDAGVDGEGANGKGLRDGEWWL